MADPTQPNLGYDKTSSVDLNTFNDWFRARPEYVAKLQSFGQTPDNVHLNDNQKQQMVQLAQSLGAVVDEGGSGQEVDDSGNFRNKSHKLKTGLIIAGIAAAALATAVRSELSPPIPSPPAPKFEPSDMLITSIPLTTAQSMASVTTLVFPLHPKTRTEYRSALGATPGPIRNAPGVYAAALYVPVKVVPSALTPNPVAVPAT